MFEISQKLYGGDRKYIKVSKKVSKSTDESFFPYANFNCPYLKLGLCELFPVLLFKTQISVR